MVVAARVEFLKQKLFAGHLLTINFLPNPVAGKIKIKILVRPSPAQIHPSIVNTLSHTLDMVKHCAVNFSSVDRGHRHSDGTMEVCIWANPVLAKTSMPHQSTKVPSYIGVSSTEDKHGDSQGNQRDVQQSSSITSTTHGARQSHVQPHSSSTSSTTPGANSQHMKQLESSVTSTGMPSTETAAITEHEQSELQSLWLDPIHSFDIPGSGDDIESDLPISDASMPIAVSLLRPDAPEFKPIQPISLISAIDLTRVVDSPSIVSHGAVSSVVDEPSQDNDVHSSGEFSTAYPGSTTPLQIDHDVEVQLICHRQIAEKSRHVSNLRSDALAFQPERAIIRMSTTDDSPTVSSPSSHKDQQIDELFNEFDVNHDGRLSYPEISRFFSHLMQGSPMNDSQYVEACRNANVDVRDGIDLAAFRQLYTDGGMIALLNTHFDVLSRLKTQSWSPDTAHVESSELVQAACAWEIHTVLTALPGKNWTRVDRLPKVFRRHFARDLQVPRDEQLIEFLAKYPFIFSIQQSEAYSSSDLPSPDSVDLTVTAIKSKNVERSEFTKFFHDNFRKMRSRHSFGFQMAA